MKKVLFILLTTSLFSCGPKENLYCGKVTKLYETAAGYKVASEKHIIFYNDSLKRNIDVEVTNNVYANTTENENICFYLTEYDLNK